MCSSSIINQLISPPGSQVDPLGPPATIPQVLNPETHEESNFPLPGPGPESELNPPPASGSPPPAATPPPVVPPPTTPPPPGPNTQPGSQPNTAALRALAALGLSRGMSGLTMLSGSRGVPPSLLNIGRSTLLGSSRQPLGR